jgi:hypothetical protein
VFESWLAGTAWGQLFATYRERGPQAPASADE